MGVVGTRPTFELWARQGIGSFQHVADDPAPSQTGQHFSYVPAGDDTYCFYNGRPSTRSVTTENAPAGGERRTNLHHRRHCCGPRQVSSSRARSAPNTTPALHGHRRHPDRRRDPFRRCRHRHGADLVRLVCRVGLRRIRVIAGRPRRRLGQLGRFRTATFVSRPSPLPLEDGTWTARVEQFRTPPATSARAPARTFKVDSHAPLAPAMAAQAGRSATVSTGPRSAGRGGDAGARCLALGRRFRRSRSASGPGSSVGFRRRGNRVFSGGDGRQARENWAIATTDYGSGADGSTSRRHVGPGTGGAVRWRRQPRGRYGEPLRTFKVDTQAPVPTIVQARGSRQEHDPRC